MRVLVYFSADNIARWVICIEVLLHLSGCLIPYYYPTVLTPLYYARDATD